MHDVVLHPAQAWLVRRRFTAVRKEFETVVAGEVETGTAEERKSHALDSKIHFPDAFVLKRLLEEQRPATILEVGSFLGFSTRWLLEVSAPWHARVTSLDPNIRHRMFDQPVKTLRKYNASFLPGRLEIVEAFFGEAGECSYEDYESYQPVRSRDYVDELVGSRRRIDANWDARFDFIFLDGDHEESAVMRDFGIAVQLLRSGGCIAFHDTFSWVGVRKALKRIKREYNGRAKVTSPGQLDYQILGRALGKSVSGIGLFQPLPATYSTSEMKT